MSKNESILPVCLNVNHWNIFDINCIKCKAEVKKSGLLNDEEYCDWLDGKFTLGFNLKLEEMQVV